MSKQDFIIAEGVVAESLGYENFRVTLDSGISILASPCGRMRIRNIRVMAGDRVQVEISPYDLTRGRITYRYNAKRQETA